MRIWRLARGQRCAYVRRRGGLARAGALPAGWQGALPLLGRRRRLHGVAGGSGRPVWWAAR
eukprot:3868307-Pleurochrysis_carterae.AAC.1